MTSSCQYAVFSSRRLFFRSFTYSAEIYELPAPVSKRALHFIIPSTTATTTGYTTVPLPVANIICLVALAWTSQIEVWCFALHRKRVVFLRHSDARCLTPVQLKHSFFSDKIFIRDGTSATWSQSADFCRIDS